MPGSQAPATPSRCFQKQKIPHAASSASCTTSVVLCTLNPLSPTLNNGVSLIHSSWCILKPFSHPAGCPQRAKSNFRGKISNSKLNSLLWVTSHFCKGAWRTRADPPHTWAPNHLTQPLLKPCQLPAAHMHLHKLCPFFFWVNWKDLYIFQLISIITE